MSDGGGGAVDLVWRDQSRWSQAAGAVKARTERVRWAILGLSVAGAVLGTASAQLADRSPGPARGLALAAAVALAVVAWLAQRSGLAELQEWIGLRAVSEELKGEAYTYLAGVAPYRGPDAAERLLDRTAHVTDALGDLGRHLGGVEPVARPVPEVGDVASYIDRRVRPQIDDYYRPRAKLMHRRLVWARRAEAALGAAGAVLGVVATVADVPQASAWVAVLTTVTGTVAAHVAASRWEFQEIEFQRTATQLERLVARYLGLAAPATSPPGPGPTGPTEEDDDAFVAECERVISIENEGWMARWSGQPPAEEPAPGV